MAIQIEIADDGTVDKDTVRLKKNQDSIHWKQKHGKNFTVSFATSPFSSNSFNQNKPDSGTSGTPGTFTYTVTVGAVSGDPSVIIDA